MTHRPGKASMCEQLLKISDQLVAMYFYSNSSNFRSSLKFAKYATLMTPLTGHDDI